MNSYSKSIEFDEAKHQYKVMGKVVPSVTEMVAPLTYSKYRVDNAVVEQAAYRGSLIHELTALWDRGDLEEDSQMAADVALYLQAWINFCHDYSPKWEYIELPIASGNYAGTIDRIGEIDGKKVVVDIKTTSSMDRANKIALCTQILGYVFLCWENNLNVSFCNSIGVQLKKDGTYSVINADDVETKYQFNSSELWDHLMFINKLTKGDRSIE